MTPSNIASSIAPAPPLSNRVVAITDYASGYA